MRLVIGLDVDGAVRFVEITPKVTKSNYYRAANKR